MSNRNRTSKPERREARRRNPMMCAAIGTAATARLRRTGVFRTDAGALGHLTMAMENHADPMPLDLNARVAEALTWSRERIALMLDVPVEYITCPDPGPDAVTARTLDDIAEMFTEQVLRPELERAGLDPNRYVYAFGGGDLDPWDSPEVIAPTGAPPAPDLRGAGVLTFPASLEIPDGCREPELHAAMAAMLAEDIPGDADPAIEPASTCIECGDEFEGTGDICSAGCGYSLTGEYPPAYEKDYGSE